MKLPACLVATSNTATVHPQHRSIKIGISPSKTGKMDEFWIGRHQDADIVLLDGTVSRKHACLKFYTDTWNILDNGSSNGVMLNEKCIPKNKYVCIAYGDSIKIVNNTSSFEWKFQPLAVEVKTNITEKELLTKKKDETCNLELSKMNQEKLNLEQKVLEIEKEKKELEEQKQEMVKTLSKERKSFVDKQANELTKFEDEIKATKQEAIHVERTLFEQRLKDEKKVAEEQLDEKEKELTKTVNDTETRIQKLIGEKDNIIISLEFEMEQNKQKIEEMKIMFDKQLKQLDLDCKNEKATIQEHKSKIDDLKNNFSHDLTRNQKEMAEVMARIRSEKEKEQKEKNIIRQELKEREAEIARLKQELNQAHSIGAHNGAIHSVRQTNNVIESDCPNDEISAQFTSEIKAINNDKSVPSNEKLDFLSKCNEELKCSICDELFIEPMALGCGHVYCRFCLEQWEINCGNCFGKFNCPNCREPITQFNKSLQLDNLIKSMYKGLSETLQKEREDLIQERKDQELKAKEKQELEKQQREQEQLERQQNRRGRRNQRVGGRTTRVMRESFADQARQHRGNVRDLQAERRRGLQNRVREMRERLAASEQQNTEVSIISNSPTTRSRVRTTINDVRQRLLTEMSTINRGDDGASENISQARPSRTRHTGRIQASGRSIYVSAQTTPPPVVDVEILDVTTNGGGEGSADPPQDRTVDLSTQENEWANDPDDAEGTVSSSSVSTSQSTDSSSTTSETMSDSSIEGLPGYYYGGYGECFICGRGGHWAPGCPFNV